MKVILILGLAAAISCPGVVDGAAFKQEKVSLMGTTLSVKEPIDPGRKYYMGYVVNEATKEITFEVEVETLGYVGFGISPNGGMTGADLFIAGVYTNPTSNVTTYSGDYHGTRNGMPTLDDQQDWTLLESEENATHTRLRFSRLLDTCDKQGDYPITMDTARVVWSMGPSDDLGYHEERGTLSWNFLLPDMHFNPEEFQYFETTVSMTMPEEHTAYWCTIHKGPELSKKHHIVAFDAHLPSREAIEHSHHFILFQCKAPAGENPDEFFGKHVGAPGNRCFDPPEEQTIPWAYCQEQMVAWTKGGKTIVFPDEVGYPIGEEENGQNLYYMLEVHYDNPEEVKGRQFTTGLRTFYTDELREQDAGLILMGHQTNPSLLVPPKTKDYLVIGHCSAECTANAGMPEEGIKVFNSLLHGHLSAKKIKTRHFRNGEELPWFDNDENYDFNFQQNKALTQYKTILPGDQLTVECTYDSTWHPNGQAIPGGFTSRDEMCQDFIFYYPAVDLARCESYIEVEEGMRDLGFEEFHDEEINGFPSVWIDEPEQFRGPYVDAVSFKVEWTEAFLKGFQEKRRFGTHKFECGRKSGHNSEGTLSYPEVREEYVPVDQCDL